MTGVRHLFAKVADSGVVISILYEINGPVIAIFCLIIVSVIVGVHYSGIWNCCDLWVSHELIR
jgi:hypothetical protein